MLFFAVYSLQNGICYISREKTGGKAIGEVGEIATGEEAAVVSCIFWRGA